LQGTVIALHGQRYDPAMSGSGLVGRLAGAGLDAPVIDEGHPDYDRLRRVYNAVIERRPRAIIEAAGPTDVRKVVAIAAATGVPLAIRGGGHSFAGLGTCDDGIVCVLSRLNAVRVDPRVRTVDVGGGALLGHVDAAGEPHGLVTPAGVVSHTGAGGLTLGGGMGYLSRRFGLTIDNLVEADIVTADGRISRTSAEEQPDLFWGIRGGGGNFGVVTRFRFRMHPIGPVLIRRWDYPPATTAETLTRYREAAAAAPRELSTAFLVGRDQLHLRAIWSGSTSGAEAAIEQFAFPGGVEDPRRETFVELQRSGDDALPWGRRYYSKGGFLARLDDDVIRVMADSIDSMPIPGLEVYGLQLGGAVSDVAEDATAYAGRAGAFYWISQGVWDDPADDELAIAWCRRVAARLGEHSLRANYVNEQADTGVAHSAYGDAKYRRLAQLKWQYDPTNVFRLNQNIEPIRP
jgi:FAD/FMN-containing dehydrogenase